MASWGSSLPSGLDPTDARLSLDDIERSVAAIFPTPEITASDLADMIGHGGVVLFDVRDREEFETSHLPDAVYISPDTSAESFVAEHREKLTSRVLVFYCSVGVRSARMLARVQSAIAPFRPVAAYNLRGGLFRWFAEGGAIENANGRAAVIHPYNAAWRGLLQRTLDARP